MRVLITGAAGFIGSNLVREILDSRPNWKLVLLDKLTYAGNLENLADVIDAGQAEFVRGDIASEETVQKLFREHDIELVFHLAAESHVDRSIQSAAPFVVTNVLGTQVLLDAARQHGVKRFIHISTDEVYGSLGDTGRFVESTPLDPTSPYAASKAASDLLVLATAKTHRFDACITRCTNNYGPYQFPEKLIPLFVTNALEDKPLPLYGDGMHVRSWIHVRDHASALIAVAERGKMAEVYNIGAGEDGEIPNREVTRCILEILKKPETLVRSVADRAAHDRRYAVDAGKARRELDWQPKVSFADGVRSTIEWYVAHREWWQRVKSGAYRDYYESHYGHRLAEVPNR